MQAAARRLDSNSGVIRDDAAATRVQIGTIMGSQAQSKHQTSMLPDILARLDQEFVEILELLDGPAATNRIMQVVPEATGVDLAWIGEPVGADRMVLQHPVNTVTNLVRGIVVPVGTGLGGKVMTARRPMWVGDYCESSDISHHHKAPAAAEGIKAMIAVPVIHRGQLLGVLYGANRGPTPFGDRTAQAMEQVGARVAAAASVAERARHAAEVAVHEERRLVALKLHDTVGAVLFTLRAGIRRLSDEVELDDQIRNRLNALEQQAAEASEALRGSLRVLSAPPSEVALGVALRGHCRAFQERTDIPARLIMLTDLPTLPQDRIATLADAAREALLNVEKHARARSVVVSVYCQRDGVAVTIADDGVGLNDEPSGGHGLGLAATAERLARVGGTVSIGSNEDGGVTVQAWLPQ
jgi:signal transduction histidine kinase